MFYSDRLAKKPAAEEDEEKKKEEEQQKQAAPEAPAAAAAAAAQPPPAPEEPEDPATAAERAALEAEAEAMRAMGLPAGGFATTAGVGASDERAKASGYHVKSTRQARQYMNRRGGFNRPLPAERTGQKVLRD